MLQFLLKAQTDQGTLNLRCALQGTAMHRRAAIGQARAPYQGDVCLTWSHACVSIKKHLYGPECLNDGRRVCQACGLNNHMVKCGSPLHLRKMLKRCLALLGAPEL